MARKLVTIRQIRDIVPIQGADNIELALVDGWQCVVKKGEFQKGGYGLYFEIDSAIPLEVDETELINQFKGRFAFLGKNARNWNDKLVAVIKTMKLRKQLSQGLLLPLELFPEITGNPANLLEVDFSERLGVEKYEKEVPDPVIGEKDISNFSKKNWLARTLFLLLPRSWAGRLVSYLYKKKAARSKKLSTFPHFIRKTDEERIQNLWHKLSNTPGAMDEEYEATLKMDGSSMTVYVKDKVFGHCSRNQKLGLEDGSNFSYAVKKYDIQNFLPSFCLAVNRNLAFQGELMGPGIQSNREGLKDYEFYVFKIWDIDKQRYLSPEEKLATLQSYNWGLPEGNKLKTVSNVLGEGLQYLTLSQFKTIDDILAFAEGPSLVNPVREGLVFTKKDGSSSFKAISNKYLLEVGG